MKERRSAGKYGCKTGGIKERRDAGKERFKRRGMQIWFCHGTNKKTTILIYKNQCFFIRRCSFGLFCLLNVLLRAVLRNTKFRETMRILSRNTKLVSPENIENFVRKKLECQP